MSIHQIRSASAMSSSLDAAVETLERLNSVSSRGQMSDAERAARIVWLATDVEMIASESASRWGRRYRAVNARAMALRGRTRQLVAAI